MATTIVKRSVAVGRHKTSLSLERAFWQALNEIALTRNLSLAKLLHQIDSKRSSANLASHVRIFVLDISFPAPTRRRARPVRPRRRLMRAMTALR